MPEFSAYVISAPLDPFGKRDDPHYAYVPPLTRKVRKNLKESLNVTLGERRCNEFREKHNTNGPNL